MRRTFLSAGRQIILTVLMINLIPIQAIKLSNRNDIIEYQIMRNFV